MSLNLQSPRSHCSLSQRIIGLCTMITDLALVRSLHQIDSMSSPPRWCSRTIVPICKCTKRFHRVCFRLRPQSLARVWLHAPHLQSNINLTSSYTAIMKTCKLPTGSHMKTNNRKMQLVQSHTKTSKLVTHLSDHIK